MERETWKNLGIVGAATVALGCGALWYSSVGKADEAPQLVTTVRPVKDVPVPEDNGIRPPKPHVQPVMGEPSRPRIPKPEINDPGRKPRKPPRNQPGLNKPTRPAA